MELVLATHNPNKVREVEQILSARLPEIKVIGYDGPEPIEDGESFLANAMIKARAAHKTTGKSAIADDSGIVVEILGGAPGIFSARWSGSKDDKANRELLLAQLRDVPEQNRKASFVCTVALVTDFEEQSFTGVWSGSIALSARGDHGFGYDPIFVPEGFEVTAAELEPELKNAISHRGMALAQLAASLRPQ